MANTCAPHGAGDPPTPLPPPPAFLQRMQSQKVDSSVRLGLGPAAYEVRELGVGADRGPDPVRRQTGKPTGMGGGRTGPAALGQAVGPREQPLARQAPSPTVSTAHHDL